MRMTKAPKQFEQIDDASLEDAGDPPSQLTEAQLAELRRRLENPSPIATRERVAAVLAKFKV